MSGYVALLLTIVLTVALAFFVLPVAIVVLVIGLVVTALLFARASKDGVSPQFQSSTPEPTGTPRATPTDARTANVRQGQDAAI